MGKGLIPHNDIVALLEYEPAARLLSYKIHWRNGLCVCGLCHALNNSVISEDTRHHVHCTLYIVQLHCAVHSVRKCYVQFLLLFHSFQVLTPVIEYHSNVIIPLTRSRRNFLCIAIF